MKQSKPVTLLKSIAVNTFLMFKVTKVTLKVTGKTRCRVIVYSIVTFITCKLTGVAREVVKLFFHTMYVNFKVTKVTIVIKRTQSHKKSLPLTLPCYLESPFVTSKDGEYNHG